METVRQEGARQVARAVEFYNLDAVISVGYRVNSTHATRFRQWATRLLREHLTRGYTLNRQRFEANARELEAALALVRKTARSPELTGSAGRGLLDIVSRYAQTFLLLQRYDEGLLTEPAPRWHPAHGLAGPGRPGRSQGRSQGTRPRPNFAARCASQGLCAIRTMVLAYTDSGKPDPAPGWSARPGVAVLGRIGALFEGAMTKTSIAQKKIRSLAVRNAVSSSLLEGVRLPDSMLRDFKRYEDGAIKADDIVRETKRRYAIA